jgi:hypothetical protein
MSVYASVFFFSQCGTVPGISALPALHILHAIQGGGLMSVGSKNVNLPPMKLCL